ncbi:MAG TPA: YhbY family RNA-binding protein [Verrucomicrobiae bacterium]
MRPTLALILFQPGDGGTQEVAPACADETALSELPPVEGRPIMLPLTNAQIRALKARAQRLKAILKLGKDGISPQFLAALDDALQHHELVKVKFDEFKDQKKELSPQLAQRSGSHLVTRVGNVVVLYRSKPADDVQTNA